MLFFTKLLHVLYFLIIYIVLLYNTSFFYILFYNFKRLQQKKNSERSGNYNFKTDLVWL